MKTILLDTNVVSFILKGDPRMDLYTPHLRGCKPALSFMTVAELFQWAVRYGNGDPAERPVYEMRWNSSLFFRRISNHAAIGGQFAPNVR